MKTYLLRLVITFVLIGSTSGCSGKDKGKEGDMHEAKMKKAISDKGAGKARDRLEEPADEKAAQAPAGKKVERRIIYTATLRLLVEDFGKAEEQLQNLIEESQGIVEMSDLTARSGSSRSGQWRVRISPEKLPAFRKAAARLGEAEQNNLDSKEVTGEFYDLVEDIKSKEKELESYRKLFEQAKGIPDILAVKKELDRTQNELDRFKGRLQVLKDLTNLTTVNIWMRERGTYVPEEKPDFGTSAGRTFTDSLGALVQFGRAVALFAVAVAPWLPLVVVLTLPGLVAWRRHRRASPHKTADSSLPVLEIDKSGEEKKGQDGD
jgi:hypothetical protein